MSWLKEFVRTAAIVAATVLVTESLSLGLGDRLRGIPRAVWTDRTEPEDPSPAVTDSQFQTYVAALESMQADHSLSVEAAAEKSGLTLEELRDIERRVQKDDVLVMRARELLRKKAESLWDARREALEAATAAKPTS